MWRKTVVSMVLIMGTVVFVGCGKGNKQEELEEPPAEELTVPKESGQLDVSESEDTIRIIKPKDGSSVDWRPFVEGAVADPNAEVWVIVHPMEVSDYWVQPSVAVKEDSTWKVKIYIGRAGNLDVGKQFEIMAVANPREKLLEGKILKGWPDAQWTSQVIEVTRK